MITTTALPTAYPDLAYSYQITAVSPDNYPFTFSLPAGDPSGMSITAAGLLTWPVPVLGTPSVTINATDNHNGVGTKTFTLQVIPDPGSGTLSWASSPPTTIQLGRTYLYQAIAHDTASYPLTYSLFAPYPAGMTINAATGLVSWTPTSTQLGNNAVNIKVADPHESLTQTFTVQVNEQGSDQPPTITSVPPLYAVVGDLYRYNLTATDPGNYVMAWSLNAGPTGMVLDTNTNSLIWTPFAAQVGGQNVSVEVHDSNGGVATQTYTIGVLAADLPPVITSLPPTRAGVGVAYAYQVQANEPLRLCARRTRWWERLLRAMTINATTGYLQWPNPSATGNYPVTIQATDFAGLYVQQAYTIVVSTTAPGYPPQITSTPPLYAAVNVAYPYTVTANDPQGGTITYTYSTSPSMSNFSVNSTSGVVTWTPNSSELGTETITITATDTAGLTAVQTFNVSVVNSLPPTISSGTPPSTITAGLTFIFQVQASDPAGDTLTYSLITPPSGMAIDQSGRITWATTATNIGGPYTYEVKVTNPDGLSVTSPAYLLTVVADTTAPTVQVIINPNPADINSVVSFDVIASDDVGVASLKLLVNGTPVALDDNGRGQYNATTLGLSLPVVATATDAANNVGTANATLAVIDPTDNQAPVVAISAPSNLAVITSPTQVTGTVTDSHIVSWTLDEAPENGSNFTTIATGTSTVSAGGIWGCLIRRRWRMGRTRCRLTAWNAGGHVSSTSIIVNVTGCLKLGNLRFLHRLHRAGLRNPDHDHANL